MAKDRITMKFDDKALNKQLERALRKNPRVTVQTVKGFLMALAGKSARLAPVESGDLRNDCKAVLNNTTVFENQQPLSSPVVASLKALGTVGYSLPYSLRQHEDLTLRHDRTDGKRRADGSTVNMVSGGEAKFLEKPFEEMKGDLIRRLSKIPEEILK